MLKVLHILHQSHPNISGSSTRTHLLLKWSSLAGTRNVAITSPFQEPFDLKHKTTYEFDTFSGTKFYRTYLINGLTVGKPSGLFIKVIKFAIIPYFIYKVLKTAKHEKPDILHAHATFICAISALIAGRALRIPVVYEVRSLWFQNSNFRASTYLRKFITKIEKFCIQKSDFIVTISTGLKEYIIQLSGQSNICVIRNAIDDNEIINPIKTKNQSTDTVRIGYIGSLIDLEGIDLVFEAINPLNKEGLAFSFDIYGAGSEYERLKKIAKDMQLPVTFHGQISPKNIPKIYDNLDIIINYRRKNSVSEAVTPLKPLEALLQQKLLICSDVGGYREILDSKHAIYVKPDCPSALTNVLRDILINKRDFHNHIEAAYNFVVSERLWSANAKKYLNIYKDTIKAHTEK